jgi:molybdopterin synthase catalytic subunit
MIVTVKLFAAARDVAAAKEVSVEVYDGATMADVEEALLKELPALQPIVRHARWALDAAFATRESTVSEHAEIALIPPVSGG